MYGSTTACASVIHVHQPMEFDDGLRRSTCNVLWPVHEAVAEGSCGRTNSTPVPCIRTEDSRREQNVILPPKQEQRLCITSAAPVLSCMACWLHAASQQPALTSWCLQHLVLQLGLHLYHLRTHQRQYRQNKAPHPLKSVGLLLFVNYPVGIGYCGIVWDYAVH